MKKLVITITLLSLFGLFMVFTSSYVWAEYKFQDPFKYVKNQGFFLLLSFICFFITSKIPLKTIEKHAKKILYFSIFLLILVIIPGIGSVRNGSRSWFQLGPFAIQPSELSKLALLIYTSSYLKINEKKIKKVKTIFPVLFYLFFSFALIMLQPDFGTGVILVCSIVGLLFVGKVPIHFFLKIGALSILGVTSLIIVAPYRLKRILSFLNPWSDPLGSGFQMIQSLYAIGPSGLFGTGIFKSIQKHFYLPEPQTDFIFSIVAEELGFLGVLVLIFLFLYLIIIGVSISKKSKDLFLKYLSFGIIFSISFQTILNLMVVVGLIPVTGFALLLYS